MGQKQVTEKILKVLHEVPATRNSDTLLVAEIWKRFYPNFLVNGEYVSIYNLDKVPTHESIKRARATIQNTKKLYQATDPRVLEKRNRNRVKVEKDLKELKQVPKSEYEATATGQGFLFGEEDKNSVDFFRR